MKNKDTRNHVQTKQTLKKDEEEEEEKIYVYINSKKEVLTTARRFAFSREFIRRFHLLNYHLLSYRIQLEARSYHRYHTN